MPTPPRLQAAVDGEPGQQVAVMTTIWKDDEDNQNEVLTIESVSADRRSVTFTEALQHHHYG